MRDRGLFAICWLSASSGHVRHLHVAAGYGLHHLAGILELFHQAVHVGHRRAAALGDALAAVCVDDFGVLALGRGHRRNDRLGLLEHVVRDVHVLEHLAYAGKHSREVFQVAHLFDLLDLNLHQCLKIFPLYPSSALTCCFGVVVIAVPNINKKTNEKIVIFFNRDFIDNPFNCYTSVTYLKNFTI